MMRKTTVTFSKSCFLNDGDEDSQIRNLCEYVEDLMSGFFEESFYVMKDFKPQLSIVGGGEYLFATFLMTVVYECDEKPRCCNG